MPRGSGRSLRQRIAVGILGVTALTVLLFALPLAVAVGRLDRSQEFSDLQSDATRVSALVPDNRIGTAGQVPVPARAPSGAVIGVYTPGGQRAGGVGPETSAVARSGADGRVHRGGEGGELAVAVPVTSDGSVVAVVRAATPTSEVTSLTRRHWAAMALLAFAVLAVGAVLARRQARRIAAPLERLTVAARALGDGDFTVGVERSGIREADLAAAALGDTAHRLGQLLDRERAFSADASHQLKTPLAALLLGLESTLARPSADRDTAMRAAISRGRQLQETVEDLLSLRRDVGGGPGSLDLGPALQAVAEHWSPLVAARGRHLHLELAPLPPAVTSSSTSLRHILDVLIDNALVHGTGAVTLFAQAIADAVSVEVSDEGAGLQGDAERAFTRRSPDARGHGIGLALARSLAEADGGRLVVRRAGPRPVFAVLLPVAETVLASAAPPGDQRSTS